MLTFLLITAIPVCFLIYYLDRKDKVKPEPTNKLLACFGLGMFGGIIGGFIIEVFAWIGFGSRYDSLFYGDIIAGAVSAAVFVSISYFILWKYSVKNADFDEFFDGPVYATCIVFGYQVICDLFSISSDEWLYVGLVSIMGTVAIYGAALLIGYYYALAHFGKMEMTGGNKFKIWFYPFAVIWAYNTLIYWYNTSILGTIVGIIAFGVMAYFIYKKNDDMLNTLKKLDTQVPSEQ